MASTTRTSTIDHLRSRFRGAILQPGDAGYDAARTVYNAMIDKRPAVIAQCTDAADAIAAVDYGRERRLPTAIRGAGTTGPGSAYAIRAW